MAEPTLSEKIRERQRLLLETPPAPAPGKKQPSETPKVVAPKDVTPKVVTPSKTPKDVKKALEQGSSEMSERTNVTREAKAGTVSAEQEAENKLWEAAYSSRLTPGGAPNALAEYLSSEVQAPTPTLGAALSPRVSRTPEQAVALAGIESASKDNAERAKQRALALGVSDKRAQEFSNFVSGSALLGGWSSYTPAVADHLASVLDDQFPDLTDEQRRALSGFVTVGSTLRREATMNRSQDRYEDPASYTVRVLGAPGSALIGAGKGVLSGEGATSGALKGVQEGASFTGEGMKQGEAVGEALGSRTAGRVVGGAMGLVADVLVPDVLGLAGDAVKAGKAVLRAPVGDAAPAALRAVTTGVYPGEVVNSGVRDIWAPIEHVEAAREAVSPLRDALWQDYKMGVLSAPEDIAAANKKLEDAYVDALAAERKVAGVPDTVVYGKGGATAREVPSAPLLPERTNLLKDVNQEISSRVSGIPKVFAREVSRRLPSATAPAEVVNKVVDEIVRERLSSADELVGGMGNTVADRIAWALNQGAMQRVPANELGKRAAPATVQEMSRVLEGGGSVLDAVKAGMVAGGVRNVTDDAASRVMMSAVHRAEEQKILTDSAVRLFGRYADPASARRTVTRLSADGADVARASDLGTRGSARDASAWAESTRKLVQGRTSTDAFREALKQSEALERAGERISQMRLSTKAADRLQADVAASALKVLEWASVPLAEVVDEAGRLLPDEALSSLAKTAVSGTYATLQHLMKAGMLGGAYLPNIKYHAANFLTAPLIMYAQLGTRTGLGAATFEPAALLWERMRTVLDTGKLSQPAFKTPTRVWTYGELDDLVASRGISVSQSGVELGKQGVDALVNAVATSSWGQKLGKHLLSVDYNVWADLADMTDTFWRKTVLVRALKQGRSVDEALQLARESLFDYSKTTKFEKEVLGKVVWFWSFRRSNLASLLKNVTSHPDRISKLARIANGSSPDAFQTGAADYDANTPLWTTVNDDETKQRWAVYGPAIPLVQAVEDVVGALTLPLEMARASKLLGTQYKDATAAVGAEEQLVASLLGNVQPMISGATKSGIGLDPQRTFDPVTRKIDPRHLALMEMSGLGASFKNLVDAVEVDPATGKPSPGSGYWKSQSSSGAQAYQAMIFAAQLAGAERASRDWTPNPASAKARGSMDPVTWALVKAGVLAPRQLREIDPNAMRAKQVRWLSEEGK